MTNLELEVIKHCKEIINQECGVNKRIFIEKEFQKLIPDINERDYPVFKLIMETLKKIENVSSKWLKTLIEENNDRK